MEIFAQKVGEDIGLFLKRQSKHIKLTEDFYTNFTTLLPVTGMQVDLLANTTYRIGFIGAVQSSSNYGGVSIALKAPPDASVLGMCHVQVDDKKADALPQIDIFPKSSTSWLDDNTKDNPVVGNWLVTTKQAGKLSLGLASSSGLYTSTLKKDKCILSIEVIA